MSDSSDDLKVERHSEENNHQSEGICRDFIRGVCGRKFCKYKHEKEMRVLNFCHDFQNSSCPRPSCKFIHCTPDEEEEYKNSGEMSNQILAEATRKAQLPGIHPVCNQFRKGLCRRTVCKYRHITKEEEEAEIMELIQNNANARGRPEHSNFPVGNCLNAAASSVFIASNGGVHNVALDESDFGPPLPKRRFIPNDLEFAESERRRRTLFKGYFAGNPPILSGVDARTIMLEEENSLLHKEIAQLKRQVSDLTATNEFLLDQNATLRVSSKRNGSVTVPAVTITNTIPQNCTPQQTQQVIRTVTASVATVPVSIATVSTGTPVSGNSVSIAGCPVSIASPAQILAPSQQILVTTNPQTQIPMTNNSQAQLAIAQQNLANNLAAAQQAQPQLTSQAQQLALAATTSQAQHVANQQLVLASTPQTQQIAISSNQQLATQLGQQLTTHNQQLTTQAQQQLALVASSQQLEMHNQMNAINTSQAIAMSNATQPMVSYPIMTQSMTHALTH